ncbi:MAG: carboxypeptidase-like regulatory domain-containing protein, partial [Gemmatimonadaceae bacterium]
MKRLHCSILLALVIMLVPALASAQERSSITGQVTAENTGQPLVGAQITLPAANLRAVSDERGRFQLLNVPRGTHTLRVVRIGFRPVTQEVRVDDAAVTVAFVMASDPLRLEEVVVTGYGEQVRRNLAGAIGSLRLDEGLRETPVTSLQQVLQGRVAGVQVVQNAGNPGNAISVRVRGSSSISGGNDPLYVIDGVPVTQGNQQALGIGFGGQSIDAMSDLSP